MTTATIRIEPLDQAAGGYPIVLEADDGKPPDKALMPADLGSPPGLAGEPIAALRAALAEASGPTPALNKLGAHLFGLLCGADFADRWQSLGAGELRVLLAIEPEELRLVPWELLREGPFRLATREDRPLSRLVEGAAGAEAPVAWPLRILVVVGAHDAAAAAEEELEELAVAFRRICGLVDLEVLHLPSATRVRNVCRVMRPHVLHVIAHGDNDPGPRLLIRDEEADDVWPWNADRTAEILPRTRPRLVILNACRSADPGAQEATWGVADAFHMLGVAAVLAMQGDISGPAAAAFSAGLYGALAEGCPVDVAVTRARTAVAERVGQDHRDWALPVLATTVPPARVLTTTSPLPPPVRIRVEDRIRGFIDRSEARRELWSALALGCEDDPEEADALTVLGASGIGKSTLVRWCLDASALNGRNVAYVNLGYDRNLRVLRILGLIAEALIQNPTHGEANQKAFDKWVAGLDRLLGPEAMSSGDDDPGRYHRTMPPKPPESATEKIFSSFLQALGEAAGDAPLVLALDHIRDQSVTDIAWDRFLVPELIEPIVNHKLEPVRLILVLRDEEGAKRLTGPLADLRDVSLGLLPRTRFRELIRVRLLFEGYERHGVDKFLQGLPADEAANDWPPRQLQEVAGLASTFGVKRVQ